jgi:hypothetical protein
VPSQGITRFNPARVPTPPARLREKLRETARTQQHAIIDRCLEDITHPGESLEEVRRSELRRDFGSAHRRDWREDAQRPVRGRAKAICPKLGLCDPSSRFSTPDERLDVQPMLGNKLRCLIGDEIKVVADKRAA